MEHDNVILQIVSLLVGGLMLIFKSTCQGRRLDYFSIVLGSVVPYAWLAIAIFEMLFLGSSYITYSFCNSYTCYCNYITLISPPPIWNLFIWTMGLNIFGKTAIPHISVNVKLTMCSSSSLLDYEG